MFFHGIGNYPSVKFVRQKKEGDWTSVFEELKELI
jgi:hypothetical protein